MAEWTATRRGFLARLGALAAPVCTASVRAAPVLAARSSPSDPEIDVAALAWDELRDDADSLLKLALDFHARLEDADPTQTLPAELAKEARRIEKAARAIQDRLRGEP